MAESRVHPATADTHPPPSKPVPPPATYVVQLPREQILRYPPPGNATKFEALTRTRNRCRTSCCCCCCFTLCLLLLVSAGVLYLVFRFKSPHYTLTDMAVRGMNVASAAPISPEFNVTIRANNPNGKVGIHYLKGSSVSVFYGAARLGDGVLPAFYQPRKNVTLLRTALTGSDVVLGGAVRTALRGAGRVPFVVRTKVPVVIEAGSVKTWEIIFKVKCDVVLDALNETAKIVSQDCDYRVRLWP